MTCPNFFFHDAHCATMPLTGSSILFASLFCIGFQPLWLICHFSLTPTQDQPYETIVGCWTIPYICWEEEKLQRSSGGVTMRHHDKWLLDSKYTRWHIFCGGASGWQQQLVTSASKSSIRRFVITEKAPTTRAFSWLKAATTAFTFNTLLRHYAKRALTPRSLNVKLGPRRNYHKGLRTFGWTFLKHNCPQCPRTA